jgi:hypothetical protein
MCHAMLSNQARNETNAQFLKLLTYIERWLANFDQVCYLQTGETDDALHKYRS